jgi:ribosomal protein L12E/L44/L45/RPP1/RPP2
MEEIFYAVLSLHIAGKSVNKESIRAVLSKAGTSVNEQALDAMAAFVETLGKNSQGVERDIDRRIVKFLTSELSGQKVKTKQLEVLLAELSKAAAAIPETQGSGAGEMATAVEGEEKAAIGGPAPETGVSVRSEGRYVYGVIAGDKEVSLGPIGIEGSGVYTIPYEDIGAIVHRCSIKPYRSNDDELVKGWVRTHQNVLDVAHERLGVVIPLGFDTILEPRDNETSPDQVVRDWLKRDYQRLREVMRKIEGKDEYAVQISYEPGLIAKRISEQNEEIRKIKEEMAVKPPGTAYMYRQKLERVVKVETERFADEWFNDFYTGIKKHADDIVIEKIKKMNNGRVMLLNLSCLVAGEKVEGLGKELEEINDMDGFCVHFSGPWPPYSFVSKPVATFKGE